MEFPCGAPLDSSSGSGDFGRQVPDRVLKRGPACAALREAPAAEDCEGGVQCTTVECLAAAAQCGARCLAHLAAMAAACDDSPMWAAGVPPSHFAPVCCCAVHQPL